MGPVEDVSIESAAVRDSEVGGPATFVRRGAFENQTNPESVHYVE